MTCSFTTGVTCSTSTDCSSGFCCGSTLACRASQCSGDELCSAAAGGSDCLSGECSPGGYCEGELGDTCANAPCASGSYCCGGTCSQSTCDNGISCYEASDCTSGKRTICICAVSFDVVMVCMYVRYLFK
jgi:hypothetical protein